MVCGGEKIMCGRYSLFFDDEYDYDIAKMMDILKRKYLFNLPERRTLYMAGFYSFFKDEPRFIILTTSANPSVSVIRHRMPMVLDKSQIQK